MSLVDPTRITKRAFIVFINGLNNVYLDWMADPKNEFTIKNEQETA